MKAVSKGLLYWNTVKNLKPVQIRHQVLNRVKKRRKLRRLTPAPGHGRIRIAVPELDGDTEYLGRFDIEALMEGGVLLLHERHGLDGTWKARGASHLWNYNLHYLEFLIPLSVRYHATGEEKYKKKYAEILASWLDSADRSGDAYEPYTISMRIPNLLASMDFLGGLEPSLERRLYASLFSQYRYLQRHPELALLANHYLENLKAAVIGSILFHEQGAYRKYFCLFLEQVKEQVLPDGMHYERSLTYQKIILEDLLRIHTVLRSSGHGADAERLVPWIRRMAEAAGSLEKGFAHTPLFNDAGDNVGRPCGALLGACRRICGDIDTERTAFPYAGYYRLDRGRCSILFDCGDIGPKYMGGHAHNDCLSFELSIGGEDIFVNSGTGQYQGDMRQFFRSTAAHSTVMIDGREQSELWGEHRVARRISRVEAVFGEGCAVGCFRSYQGDSFRRRLCWQGGALVIEDGVRCRDAGRHTARQLFHLAPGLRLVRTGDGAEVVRGGAIIAAVRAPGRADILIHSEGQIAVYAPEFGRYERKQVLEVRTSFEGSVQLRTTVFITEDLSGGIYG